MKITIDIKLALQRKLDSLILSLSINSTKELDEFVNILKDYSQQLNHDHFHHPFKIKDSLSIFRHLFFWRHLFNEDMDTLIVTLKECFKNNSEALDKLRSTTNDFELINQLEHSRKAVYFTQDVRNNPLFTLLSIGDEYWSQCFPVEIMERSFAVLTQLRIQSILLSHSETIPEITHNKDAEEEIAFYRKFAEYLRFSAIELRMSCSFVDLQRNALVTKTLDKLTARINVLLDDKYYTQLIRSELLFFKYFLHASEEPKDTVLIKLLENADVKMLLENNIFTIKDVVELAVLPQNKITSIIQALQHNSLRMIYPKAPLNIDYLSRFTEAELIKFATLFADDDLLPFAFEFLKQIIDGSLTIKSTKNFFIIVSERFNQAIEALQIPEVRRLYSNKMIGTNDLLVNASNVLRKAAIRGSEPAIYPLLEKGWISISVIITASPKILRELAAHLQPIHEKLQNFIINNICTKENISFYITHYLKQRANVQPFLLIFRENSIFQLLEEQYLTFNDLNYYLFIDCAGMAQEKKLNVLIQFNQLMHDIQVIPLLEQIKLTKETKTENKPLYLMLRLLAHFSLNVVKEWLVNASLQKAMLTGLISFNEFYYFIHAPNTTQIKKADLRKSQADVDFLIKEISHPLISPCIASEELQNYKKIFDADSSMPTPIIYLSCIYQITQLAHLKYYFLLNLLSAKDVINVYKDNVRSIKNFSGNDNDQLVFHTIALLRFIQKMLKPLQEKILLFKASSYVWRCKYIIEIEQQLQKIIAFLNLKCSDTTPINDLKDFSVLHKELGNDMNILCSLLKQSGNSGGIFINKDWEIYCIKEWENLNPLLSILDNRRLFNGYLKEWDRKNFKEVVQGFMQFSLFTAGVSQLQFYTQSLPRDVLRLVLNYYKDGADLEESVRTNKTDNSNARLPLK